MDNITIGQVVTWLSIGVGGLWAFVQAMKGLSTVANNIFTKAVNKVREPKEQEFLNAINDIKNMLEENTKETKENRVATLKQYLVGFLSDIEHNRELDEVEIERGYEAYDEYILSGHNGYIKDRWNKVMKNYKRGD